MATSTSVTVTTSQYEHAHGKRPAGRGYWAFDIGNGPEFCPGDRLYSEAKRWAVDLAKERGVSIVVLCS